MFKFIEEYNGKFDNVTLESVDCDENKELADKNNIENIPTIILHKDNNNIEYKGVKEIEDIKKWLTEEIKK